MSGSVSCKGGVSVGVWFNGEKVRDESRDWFVVDGAYEVYVPKESPLEQLENEHPSLFKSGGSIAGSEVPFDWNGESASAQAPKEYDWGDSDETRQLRAAELECAQVFNSAHIGIEEGSVPHLPTLPVPSLPSGMCGSV